MSLIQILTTGSTGGCNKNRKMCVYNLGGIKNTTLRNKLKLNHDYDLSCVDHLCVRTGVPLSLKNYMFYGKLFLRVTFP